MLFVSSEFSKPKRIQGAYISENEIHEVTDFIRANNKASETADSAVEQTVSQPTGYLDGGNSNDEEDDLYDSALQVVREAQKASASLLQRRLKVGYARAARLLDIMEAKGMIGPGDGAKPREVFFDQESGNVSDANNI